MHPCGNEGLAVVGLARRSKSQGELRESWGGRAFQQWEEDPRWRPREDEVWDDGGRWEEGGRWNRRGQWETARRMDSSRNTGFAHVVQEAIKKERSTGDSHKPVDQIKAIPSILKR